MPWTLHYDDALALLQIDFVGRLDAGEVRAAAIATIAATAQHACPFHLCDCTGYTQGPSIFELVALVDDLRSLGLPPSAHLAVLAPHTSGIREDIAFWETATRNRGFDVRVFGTRDGAVAWLTQLQAAGR